MTRRIIAKHPQKGAPAEGGVGGALKKQYLDTTLTRYFSLQPPEIEQD